MASSCFQVRALTGRLSKGLLSFPKVDSTPASTGGSGTVSHWHVTYDKELSGRLSLKMTAPNPPLARSPVRAILGPTVFVGTVHVRASATADPEKIQKLEENYLQLLDGRLRRQHSLKRWFLVAHEAEDGFKFSIVFERAQAASRLDNVAAGFVRHLDLTIISKGAQVYYNMKRRKWIDVAGIAFTHTDCAPAPEGSFSQAVSAARAEAHRQARQGSKVQELSSTTPAMPPKPVTEARTVPLQRKLVKYQS